MTEERLQIPSQLQGTRRRLWRAVFWISSPFGILSFVLLIYGNELSASAHQLGGFSSAIPFVLLVLRPVPSRALNWWGGCPSPLLGLFGYAAIACFCVADIVGAHVRGAGLGLYTFAYVLGAYLGPLRGLYDHVGHATPFYLNTVVHVIGIFLVILALNELCAVGARRVCPPATP